MTAMKDINELHIMCYSTITNNVRYIVRELIHAKNNIEIFDVRHFCIILFSIDIATTQGVMLK